MRASLACAITFLICIALFARPALAVTSASTFMTSPYIDSNDFIYLEPSQFTSLTVSEFTSTSAVATNDDALSINFPVTADGLDLGPTSLAGTVTVPGVVNASGTATANILPFGPVNLSFPSISQTAFETYGYQRTYFYTDEGSF